METSTGKAIDYFRFDQSEWEAQNPLDLHLAEFVSQMFKNCPGSDWKCLGESFSNPELQDVMLNFFPEYAFVIKPLKPGLDYCGIRDVSNVVIEIGYSSNFNHDLQGYTLTMTPNIFDRIACGNLLAFVRTNRNGTDYIIGAAWQTNALKWKLD